MDIHAHIHTYTCTYKYKSIHTYTYIHTSIYNYIVSYKYRFKTLYMILHTISFENFSDIRSLMSVNSYSSLKCWENGQLFITCTSVYISPQKHNLSSTGSRPLPLRFHLPVSTAREWLDTRNLVKATLWVSKILCLFVYISCTARLTFMTLLYISLLEDCDLTMLFLIKISSCLQSFIPTSCISLYKCFSVLYLLFKTKSITNQKGHQLYLSYLYAYLQKTFSVCS